MKSKSDTYQITITWKAFAREFLIAGLQIPLLGYGLYRLFVLSKLVRESHYEISNDDVRCYVAGKSNTINLADIEKIKVLQTGLDHKVGVSKLYISSGTNEILIPGLDNAHNLQELLDKAVAQEKKRVALQQELKNKRPKHQPGSLEKMNDLVGMWQQGLLTDEQFEEERKKFES